MNAEIMTRDNVWTLVGVVAVIIGSALGRKVLESSWRATTGKEPPLNPDTEDASWLEALAWGVTTGAIIGVVRALSRQGTSSARRRWS